MWKKKHSKRDNYDIDFVVLWVDGNDPAWRAKKKKYSPTAMSNNYAVLNRHFDKKKVLRASTAKWFCLSYGKTLLRASCGA